VPEVVSRTRLIQVLGRGRDKGIGILGVDFGRRLADDVAVEVGHWLAESYGADDEGDEEEGVDAGHYEEAEVGVGPVVADADHDVESGDAGLGLLVVRGAWSLEYVPH
jgi:hypothetical protein